MSWANWGSPDCLQNSSYYQRKDYPSWWGRAISQGTTISTAISCLAEFAHIVERDELELVWLTDPNRPELDQKNPGQPYSARYAKSVRYLYTGQLPTIRSEAETLLQSVRKTVELLPQARVEIDFFETAVKAWLPSTSDFSDAVLVAAAMRAGVPRIISDDADLISFEGITLYTANRNAVDAAKAAGTLIP